MSASASPVPPRRAKRGRAGRSEAAPLLRRPKAQRPSGQPGPREWRPAAEEEPSRVTSPPARGEPPSPAPRAARCPLPGPFPWWRRGRAGAEGQGGGRAGGSGAAPGGGETVRRRRAVRAAPLGQGRAGRVSRSPRRRRRLRGSGGALSRARLPAPPAAPRVWRRRGAGSEPAAPGRERLARLRQPQAASGSGRCGRQSPRAFARSAGPLGGGETRRARARRPPWDQRQVGTAEPAGALGAPRWKLEALCTSPPARVCV